MIGKRWGNSFLGQGTGTAGSWSLLFVVERNSLAKAWMSIVALMKEGKLELGILKAVCALMVSSGARLAPR